MNIGFIISVLYYLYPLLENQISLFSGGNMKFARYALLLGIFMLIPAAVSATEYFVSIVDFSFEPPALTINDGDIVTWTNNGAIIHTSTSNTGVWDSGILNPGNSFSFTFNGAGDYQYHCAIHTTMTGTITVNPSNVPTLSEWGMILMGLLLIGAGTIAVIRKKKYALAGR